MIMKRIYMDGIMVYDVNFVDKKPEWAKLTKAILQKRIKRAERIKEIQKKNVKLLKQEDAYIERMKAGGANEQLFYEMTYYLEKEFESDWTTVIAATVRMRKIKNLTYKGLIHKSGEYSGKKYDTRTADFILEIIKEPKIYPYINVEHYYIQNEACIRLVFNVDCIDDSICTKKNFKPILEIVEAKEILEIAEEKELSDMLKEKYPVAYTGFLFEK